MLERPTVHDPPRPDQVGHDNGGYPEPQLAVVRDEFAVRRGGAIAGVYDVGGVGVVDHLRRCDVVVEPAPLVEGDDEDRIVEVTVVGQGMVGVGNKPLSEPYIR